MKGIFNRSVLILLGIVLINSALFSNAYAKWKPGSFEDIVDTADLILVGEVIDINQTPEGNFVIFKVERVIKGDKSIKAVRIKIRGDAPGRACLPPNAKYKKGERCLVFLKKWEWGDYFTWYNYQGKCDIENGYVISELSSGRAEKLLLDDLVNNIKSRLDYLNNLQPFIDSDILINEER